MTPPAPLAEGSLLAAPVQLGHHLTGRGRESPTISDRRQVRPKQGTQALVPDSSQHLPRARRRRGHDNPAVPVLRLVPGGAHTLARKIRDQHVANYTPGEIPLQYPQSYRPDERQMSRSRTVGEVDEIFRLRKTNLARVLESRYDGSQARLAHAISKSPTTLWRLLTSGPHEKHMGERLARDIEKALLLPRGWLDDVARELQVSAAGSEVRRDAADRLHQRSDHIPSPVPLFSAAGALAWVNSRTSEGKVAMVWCNTPLSDGGFALIVSGQSMEPDFYTGDRVFVGPALTAQTGDIVVARAGDELVIRRFRPLSDSMKLFELVARNPDYASLRAGEAELVGVVVEHHRYRAPRVARQAENG